MTRLYLNQELMEGVICELTKDSAHHVINVLRMHQGQQLVIFNGKGGQYSAEIASIRKNRVEVHIKKFHSTDLESNLNITLVQGISRSQRMDYAIQKSVELGVTQIIPVTTEFCNVHLKNGRTSKKYNHWGKVIISACEQSGRNKIPVLEDVMSVETWLGQDTNNLKFMLHPETGSPFPDAASPVENLTLLVGPEGGFSQDEYELALQYGYQAIKLGPRVLRTETAAIAAISTCQAIWGDLCK